MTDYSNDISTLDRDWDSGAPNLKSAFPSLEQQVNEYPAIEGRLSSVSYAPENNSGATVDGSNDADLQLIISGASYHVGARKYMDKDNGQIVDFNEVNPGVGLQYSISDNLSISVGGYRNSYNETSIYGVASLESDPLTEIGKITVGLDAGIISGYEGYIDERLIIGNTGFSVMASPFISVDISGISGGMLPDDTTIKANIIPGEALFGEIDNGENAPSDPYATIGLSMRMPF